MLKINFDLFDNFDNWQNKKEKILFRNEKQLLSYQNQALNRLLNNKEEYEPMYLLSSGTTSNKPKKYRFPNKIYDVIENHHMWRVMDSHGIQNGNVVGIFQGTDTNATNVFEGPQKKSSLGIENDCYQLIYNPSKIDYNFWKKIIYEIKQISPQFIYTSPSVFESFYEYTNGTFDFPIIFSCETLTDLVRKKSNSIFTNSIDKMRDWTTGFGFFECKFGVKHIYDELCLVQQFEQNKIKCTDFFNYCELFINKISDDFGNITRKICDCGIYGNVLNSFEGKAFECLVSITGKRYSANYVSNLLSIPQFPVLISYQIIQDQQKNIEFRLKKQITDDDALVIANVLNKIIMDEKNETNMNLFNNDRQIYKSSTSNVNLVFKTINFDINKNKKISLKSLVDRSGCRTFIKI